MGRKILVLGMLTLANATGQVVSVLFHGLAEPAEAQARMLAAQMLAAVGVQLEWCESAKNCRHWSDRIVVNMEAQAPPSLPSGAMAAAQLFEGRNIRIYHDRVNRLTNKSLKPRLLAYVLVHEITHLLQACDWHAPRGIMKATWTQADYAAISRTTLAFEPIDIDLIRLGLTKRRGLLALAAR